MILIKTLGFIDSAFKIIKM